ncbi:hypothetical protein NEOLEDRAFT_698921 [Neolentinus lepideus HHB14362 ss-1]|uniref:Uncharacterized protein n=1 Tax=Neolentinus lepideus HHB14362 ss-1 TaxID=1314782 RepID=A0A165V384_9AGAM|nr:hypothetical protein NEOLEDRAFT_698921 [Neolentinus lepideus HHB14362 ss-1]
MAHLLPSGYNTSYSNSEHAHYAADYSDAHETRPSYTDNYYYPQNQPAYDFVGHWQHPPAVPDQYTADQELVDRYLEPAALHSPSTTASSATLQIQGAGEQYTQAGYAENGFGGHVASSSSISCWDGQHQSYSQGNPHQNTDCDPTHYPNHSTNSQSPIYGPAPYPYPVAQGYGFESNDLSSAISTDRSGDATSPQPVDQHDWGNLSGSGQIEPRLDFGPFQAPKREPSSTVQTPASARNQDYRPLVPPTSHFSPSSSTLPFGFVQSQPHAETHPEMVQPSFFVPSHHRRLEQFKDHQRNRRAGRAAPSPYYCPTEDSHRHHHGTECSCTPLMDHLPLPDEAMQQGSPYQDETAQYAAMSPMSPDPPVVFSQPGPAVINNLGIAQLEQARAENSRAAGTRNVGEPVAGG